MFFNLLGLHLLNDLFLLLAAKVQLSLDRLVSPLYPILSLIGLLLLNFNLVQLNFQGVYLGQQERVFIFIQGFALDNIGVFVF